MEPLLTCPDCGQSGFLKLSAHRCPGKQTPATADHLPDATKMVGAQSAILLVEPSMLSHHPLLERVTMVTDLAERLKQKAKRQGKDRQDCLDAAEAYGLEFAALVADVAAHGVREPLKVVDRGDGTWLVADGRHRLAAALASGLATVPCIVVPEADVPSIIESAVATRRHMTKGAIAYLGVLLHPEVATEGAERQKAQGAPPCKLSLQGVSTGQETQGNLSQRLGVSRQLIADACRLYRVFRNRPDLREKYEDSVWTGAGLNKLSGFVEELCKGGTPERLAHQTAEHKLWKGFGAKVFDLSKHWEKWADMPATVRSSTTQATATFILNAPAEVQAELHAALAAKLKEGAAKP
jgi:hypothetical protein